MIDLALGDAGVCVEEVEVEGEDLFAAAGRRRKTFGLVRHVRQGSTTTRKRIRSRYPSTVSPEIE